MWLQIPTGFESESTWLQAVAQVLPFTYWMEIIRRAVLSKRLSPALTIWSDGELVMIMSAVTVALMVLSHLGFSLSEHGARKWGKIDQKTDHQTKSDRTHMPGPLQTSTIALD